MSIHTWPEHKACAIDFYNCGDNSWKNLESVENFLGSIMGFENMTSCIKLPRGKTTSL